ncbi:unnamed protein product, partial [Closterium sp. NIES-64]
FTREVGKGAVPIKLNATNYLIYAFSTTASTTLAFHGWNQGGLAVDFSCFKKPSALWGGGPDYSDDSDYDNSFNSARAASMDGTSTSTAGTSSADSATGGALSSGQRNRLHQQTGLGHQHHEGAVGTTAGVAGDGAVGTGPCALRPILCALCTAPYARRPMHCAPCSAPYALRPMLCAPCSAPHALRPMLCAPCSAPYALFPMLCALCSCAPCSAPYALRQWPTLSPPHPCFTVFHSLLHLISLPASLISLPASPHFPHCFT